MRQILEKQFSFVIINTTQLKIVHLVSSLQNKVLLDTINETSSCVHFLSL
jgi:hypothetical protein